MATIKANASWLSRFYVESLPHPEQRQKCATMISSMVDTVAPLFKQMVRLRLSRASCVVEWRGVKNTHILVCRTVRHTVLQDKAHSIVECVIHLE